MARISSTKSGHHIRGVNVERDTPIIIPRQRRDTSIPPCAGSLQALDPSYPELWAQYPKGDVSVPAGYVRGRDPLSDIVVFKKGFTTPVGAMIYTEGYGTNTINGYWNANGRNNVSGANIGTKPLLCASLHNFGLNGNGNQPYEQAQQCDGIAMAGSGHRLSDLDLFNIPGTAIILTGGKANTTQAGVEGMMGNHLTMVRDVFVAQALDGLVAGVTDTKILRYNAVGILGVGLHAGNGTHILDSHCWGCGEAACRTIGAGSVHTSVYYEASPIGFDIQHDGTQCQGINIGPGTTWGTCIKARGQCHVTGIFGSVRASSEEHPGIVGIDMDPNGVRSVFEGGAVVNGASTMISAGGQQCTVRMKGFGGDDEGATAVKFKAPDWSGPMRGNTYELELKANAGVFVDLRDSGLFSGTSNGGGNRFIFNLDAGQDTTPYLLPAGKTLADLRPGNTLEFNITDIG